MFIVLDWKDFSLDLLFQIFNSFPTMSCRPDPFFQQCAADFFSFRHAHERNVVCWPPIGESPRLDRKWSHWEKPTLLKPCNKIGLSKSDFQRRAVRRSAALGSMTRLSGAAYEGPEQHHDSREAIQTARLSTDGCRDRMWLFFWQCLSHQGVSGRHPALQQPNCCENDGIP